MATRDLRRGYFELDFVPPVRADRLEDFERAVRRLVMISRGLDVDDVVATGPRARERVPRTLGPVVSTEIVDLVPPVRGATVVIAIRVHRPVFALELQCRHHPVQ